MNIQDFADSLKAIRAASRPILSDEQRAALKRIEHEHGELVRLRGEHNRAALKQRRRSIEDTMAKASPEEIRELGRELAEVTSEHYDSIADGARRCLVRLYNDYTAPLVEEILKAWDANLARAEGVLKEAESALSSALGDKVSLTGRIVNERVGCASALRQLTGHRSAYWAPRPPSAYLQGVITFSEL